MKVAYCVLAIVLAGASFHAIEAQHRWRLLRSYLEGNTTATARILREYGPVREGCQNAQPSDLAMLMVALMTVETFATPALRRVPEGALAHLSQAIGAVVPDITFGPARIRYSVAREAVQHEPALRGVPLDARQLLRSCPSLWVGTRILERYSETREASANLGYKDILDLCKRYNGQDARNTSLEALFSATVYCSLVYDIFWILRWNEG